MPKVKIDGRQIEVEPGKTVLQAAEALGLEVPQMCYHPGLSIVGVCRVCLCQVKGMPKLTPACATEIREGMEVGLYTPEAEKARRSVIEFWLLNHPLDCPVCDQGGECPLQDIAFDHGPGVSRLGDAKVKKQKRVVLGEHVILDEERCILCWRCTRFTQEVSQTNQIMLSERGVYTTVGTPPGVTLDDPFSGNVVDLCPVGALTTREFRFKSRIWEMSSSEGVCTACSVGCNTYVWSKKKHVERLTARPNLRVNDYWLCDRGRFDIEFVNDPRRLRQPKLRVDGKLIDVDWRDAINALAEGLRPASEGRAAAGALFTRHLANEEYWTFQRFVRSVLGSNHLAAGRDDMLSEARLALGKKGRLLDAMTRIDNAEAIVVLGGDLEATHPVHALRVRKAVRQHGAKLFVASPGASRLDGVAAKAERVETAKAADWLQSKAQGIAGDAKSVVLLVNAGARNLDVAEKAEAFLAGGPERRVLFLDEGGNAAGAALLGVSSRYFPGGRPVDPQGAESLRKVWGGRVSDKPGLGWPGMLAEAAKGAMSLLLVNSGRPAHWGFTAEERTQLTRAPFVVAFDLFEDEVASFAHVVLPAPSFAEFDWTFTTADGLVQLARRNIVPQVPGIIHAIHRVAGLLGHSVAGPETIAVFREIAAHVPAFRGQDYGRLSEEAARADVQEPASRGA